MEGSREHSRPSYLELVPGFWQAVAAVAVIKLVILALDHAPNFMMGDSAAFIGTALTKWFPPQRSWTYGYFIRWFCVPLHSLAPLMIAQTLASAGTCVVLGGCLRRFFAVSQGVAAGVMIACALDPLQLLYEREVLPECFALFFLALVIAGVLAYCEWPRLGTLLVLQVLYIGLISLRMQFLLPVGLLLFALPIVGTLTAGVNGRWMAKAATHLLVSAVVMVALHGAYRVAMGIKHEHPPAYTYGTRGMVLAAFAPLLQPGDAQSAAVAAAIRNDGAYPLGDRALRNDQLWNAGGLIDRLEKASGGFYPADDVEGALFHRMAMRDPLGMLGFGMGSYRDYWDFAAMPETLRLERESGPYDAAFTSLLLEHFQLDTRHYPRPGVIGTMHGWLPPWLALLLGSPFLLAAAMVCAGWKKWRESGLLLLVGMAILAQNTMLSTMTVYRYLQPLTFLALLAIGVIVQWVGSRQFDRRAG
jgi:hypothetical protein